MEAGSHAASSGFGLETGAQTAPATQRLTQLQPWKRGGALVRRAGLAAVTLRGSPTRASPAK